MDNKKTVTCPVCGTPNQLDGEGTNDTCTVCGWEDDWYQREHPDEPWANGERTLNGARKAWKNGETLYVQFPNPNSREK